MPSKLSDKTNSEIGEEKDEKQADNCGVLPRLLTENLNRNLCVCYDVPKQEVIDAFNAGAHTFEEISNQTYACQGSGCCQHQLERLIETLTEHMLPIASDTLEPSEPFENEQA